MSQDDSHPGPPKLDASTGSLIDHFADLLAFPVAARPTHIGPYKVISHIASGGMGDVYKCLDETLGIHVAVKVAQPHLAARPDAFAHIRAEARRLASIKDRTYILRVLTAGDTIVDGVTVPYIATEFVDDAEELGGPRSSAWPIDRKVAFFIKVCAAIASMHEQRLIHADIKPSNILVVGAEPRIIDFGIARVVRRLGGHQDQPLAGTPGYLDPALHADADARPDHRTDIYCLGLTLAAFLAGARPECDPLGALLWPSAARPPSVRGALIDADLDVIMLKAIDQDPSRRFTDVRDLASALQRWLRHRRTLSVRVSPLVGIAACSIVAVFAAYLAYRPLADSPLVQRTQRISTPSVEQALSPASINSLCVIRFADEDLPTIVAAAKARGVEVPLDRPGGTRMVYAAIADKLAESSGVGVVGFDMYIDENRPEFDPALRGALERLARASRAGAVVIGLEHWRARPIPALTSPEYIRAACLSMHSADHSSPAMAHLACQAMDAPLARPAFGLVLACLALRPGAEPHIVVDHEHDRVSVSFVRKDADGNLTAEPPGWTIPYAQISAGDRLFGAAAAGAERVALSPIAVAPAEAIAKVTKSDPEVLAMPSEQLRTWHAGRPILIARSPEREFVSNGRTVWGYELHAALVEKMLSGAMIRLPGVAHSLSLLFAAAIPASIVVWVAFTTNTRRSIVARAAMTVTIAAILVLAAGSGGLLYARVLGYFINPLAIAMAALFAVLLTAALCHVRTRSLIG